MMQMLRKSKNQKGFTLVELVVVIVIIGILAAVAIPMYNKQTAKARVNKTQGQLTTLKSAVDAYIAENGNITGATSATFTDVAWPDGYTFATTGATVFTITAPAVVDETGTSKTFKIDQTGKITS